MPWLIDDLAGAALGPWGLAVAAGIGVGALVSKRFGPAISEAATGAATGVAAGASASRDQVRDRVTSGLTGVRDWWRDVYAEAHAEWVLSRSATNGTIKLVGAAGATSVPASAAGGHLTMTKVARPEASRVRGTNGRYVKSETA
jgi:hypothetical protein